MFIHLTLHLGMESTAMVEGQRSTLAIHSTVCYNITNCYNLLCVYFIISIDSKVFVKNQ